MKAYEMSQTARAQHHEPTDDARRASRSDPRAILQEVRNENTYLYETVQHFLNVQEKLLRLRAVTQPTEAYAIVHELLRDYLELPIFEIHRRDGSRTGTSRVFRHAVEAAADVELHGVFSADDRRHVLERRTPALREFGDDTREAKVDVRTAILTPLVFQDRTFGYVLMGVPTRLTDLTGMRLEVVDYLLKDLAAFEGAMELSAESRRAASLNTGVIESVRQGMIAVDGAGRLLCWNSAASVVLTAPASGASYRESLEPSAAELVGEVLESDGLRAPVGGRPLELSARDGRVIPLTVSATRLQVEGAGAGGWVFLFQDTSLLQEVENLRHLDALKSEFFLGLLHDMKTPLTGIISGCDLLEATLTNLDPEHREVLKIIHSSAQRMQNLAVDILDMSALQAAADDESMESADLVELVQRTVEPLILQSSGHHIDVQAPDEPIVLFCQPRRIARVVENLVGNAVKYSPSGGNVTVGVRRSDNTAEITVEDEGIGITATELPRIWERFHRAGQSRKEVEGSGLGLSIIKMIVDRHRGRVSVQSERGRGSRFTVELPLLVAPQPAEAVLEI